ncbi:MAG TPA: type II toxin-antitoxin system VapC family toxin [Candidatus Accumulibacter phosphatis]|jgi:hypothetical protein|nr:MAG: putative nucleic acid-binding protein [Candidatus Accumulibacter sp. SK-11]HCN68864.1 PIN domain-containing protein [Accumulibacter sp.]HCV14580.1 PIN domain-containing protein [Accumulibacter sp.]HRL75649.1 type II toxin-antitoxin system VapC family toxin [Candidatus Accumulibacter phosphatis]HRQ95754.1 type II toxin-antitoxin system VapC family toxin [Candidatus Accumulibacter phosphatis]
MVYLDTAVVLTLFVGERTSGAVESWLAQRPEPFAFSDWGLTECASALGIKCRRGELDAETAARAFETIAAFARQSCERIVCAAQHQAEAQAMLGRFDLNLRAGDALHLAMCRHAGATLLTYDTLLLAAARALGVKALNPLGRG